MNPTPSFPLETAPPVQGGFDFRRRLRAALVHLLLSVLVAASASALVFGVWYPKPFGEISGGRELFTLLISVDIVIGPLLTFAVFNRRKPRHELVRDLSVIAALQIAALGYGLYTTAQARPAVLAMEGQRLVAVRPIDLEDGDLARASEGLRVLPWFGMLHVGTERPAGESVLEAVEIAMAGRDYGKRPEAWRPEAVFREQAIKYAAPLAELRKQYPDRSDELDAAVAATGRPAEQLGYLPLMARKTSWVVLIDRQSGEIAGYAPFDGFF
ncbi:MAG: fimbrial assembly protein [Pseudomonadota bacterium]